MHYIDVKDNFLSPYQFKSLQTMLMGDEFPWFFQDGIVEKTFHNYQYTHTFYNERGLNSDFFSLIQPLLSKLEFKTLCRIKANSIRRTLFRRKNGYHTDYVPPLPNTKTAIFYLNTNNGGTQFKNIGKVKSIENRMVIFDGGIEHQGITCTNQKRRVVINFNFYQL
jgi:hypothetical protein